MFFPLFHKGRERGEGGNLGRRNEERIKLRLRLMVFKEEGALQERGAYSASSPDEHSGRRLDSWHKLTLLSGSLRIS